MNRIAHLAILALGILAFATLMLVVLPGIQIGSEAPTPGLKPYTAQQLRGRHVYIEQGCLYCHSQQPRSADQAPDDERGRSEEHTSELQSLMRNSYAVFCLKKKN